jgi:hypothetical protein
METMRPSTQGRVTIWILGGIAAVGVALKLYWHKIRVAIGLGMKNSAEDEVS